MPFVNRVDELWRVFEVNAGNMVKLRSLRDTPINFRLFKLLYCIQYFGAGKTTLGKQFGPQLASGVLDERGKVGGLSEEYQRLRDAGINHVHVDACSVDNMVLEVVRTVTGEASLVWTNEKDAAVQVVAAARTRGKPVLIHIDEVGSHKGHDLYSLQLFVRAVFAELWSVGHEDFSQMPLVYFLVTGKSTDFLFNLGTGGQSPVSSELLVLDMLSAQHVGQVRKHLQELNEPIKLAGLTEDLTKHLDQRLCAATGGAPRLLLYTLRALHYACVFKEVKLDSEESINLAVNHQVYEILDSVPTVKRELSPSDATDETKRAYGMLLACVLYHKHLHYETKITFGNQEYPVGRLLKSQAFFLSRDHQNLQPGEFVLTFPEYHLRAMQTEYHTGVPMLLSCFAGAALPMAEPWRLFEILPAHAMPCQQRWELTIPGIGLGVMWFLHFLPTAPLRSVCSSTLAGSLFRFIGRRNCLMFCKIQLVWKGCAALVQWWGQTRAILRTWCMSNGFKRTKGVALLL